MDDLTKRANEMEQKIISAINESQLPLVFAEYVLRNILLQIQNTELAGSQDEKKE